RRHGDYALVGVAATVTLDNNGRCEAARLVYLSVGDKPVEAVQATATLIGQKLTAEAIEAAAEIAAEQDIDPPGDIHASVPYRRHLAKVLAKQVLATATARAK
ncbi:MAG: xanthine dehydrogenase family protein subunit M, partial [Anaerolineae bacterium]|nr:xanthine dehydrogenase family protein subunit M [Anaerolineae bacterium]